MSLDQAPTQYPYARQSAGPSPVRRPGSIRRTLSIDTQWPDGHGFSSIMQGMGRDLLTPADGSAPVVLETGGFDLTCSPQRIIEAINITPEHLTAEALIGARAGGASRRALAQVMGDQAGTITYQLVDDFAGASLVSNWTWLLWMPAGGPGLERVQNQKTAGRNGDMMGVCTGFAPGSSSLLPDGTINHRDQSRTEVGPLQNLSDTKSWHDMPEQKGPKARRARRIDIWRQDGVLKVDAGFQDSAPMPTGGRMAIHEYRVFAEINEATDTLIALQVLPLILPYPECPGASIKATKMVGKTVRDLRETVLDTLSGTEGCTHLNDILRSFADIPYMAKRLPTS